MHEKLDQIRMQLDRWVRTHANREEERRWKESILLKDGCLHGYRFCVGSGEAIWIVGNVTLEIRRDGRLADTLAIAESGQRESTDRRQPLSHESSRAA